MQNKVWFDLKMRDVLIKSLKNHFLKGWSFRITRLFFRLIFPRSLTILSRYFPNLNTKFETFIYARNCFLKIIHQTTYVSTSPSNSYSISSKNFQMYLPSQTQTHIHTRTHVYTHAQLFFASNFFDIRLKYSRNPKL